MSEQLQPADTLSGGSSGSNLDAFHAVVHGPPPQEEDTVQAEPTEEHETTPEEEGVAYDEDNAPDYEAETLEEPQEPSPETHRVRAAGQELDVTLDELKAGYSRQSDYTQKTMQIADEKKALEQGKLQLQALMNDYQNALQNPAPQMEPPQRPDPAMWDDDPIEAMRQTEMYRQKMEDFQAQSAEHQRLQQQAMAQKQAQMQEALGQQQHALRERIPEWQNDEIAAKEKAEIRRFGLSKGFTEKELAGIYDSRAVELMRSAMKYESLKAKRGSVKQAPEGKNLAPGTASTSEPSQLRKGKAMAKLQKSGHIRDAASVFEHLL